MNTELWLVLRIGLVLVGLLLGYVAGTWFVYDRLLPWMARRGWVSSFWR